MNVILRTVLLLAQLRAVAGDIQFIFPQAKSILPGGGPVNVTFGERGGSPSLTELSTYVISIYSGSIDRPVLVSSNPTVTGAYDPNRGLQTATLDLGVSMSPDFYFLGIKSTLKYNTTVTVTNFSFRFAITGPDGIPSAETEDAKSDGLPQRLISCNDIPCSPPFLQADESVQAIESTPVEGTTQINEPTQTSESTRVAESTQVASPTQINTSVQISVPTQTKEPTQINEPDPPLSDTCIQRTVTITVSSSSPSRIASTGDCPSVVVTTIISPPRQSNCLGTGACPSGISAIPFLSEPTQKTGLGARIGVITFLGVLVLVVIGSAIITIRLKRSKLQETTENRSSSSWWNPTPLGGSLTNLIVQPLRINKNGSEKSQEVKSGFGEYDSEAQRPKSVYHRMKEDTGDAKRWRDSLSTIQESDSGDPEKSRALQRTLSEKRVGRLFDERTRSRYYGTGDI